MNQCNANTLMNNSHKIDAMDHAESESYVART